jgi:hypothetical protein
MATIRLSKAASNSYLLMVGVTFGMGTTTFDNGISSLSTANAFAKWPYVVGKILLHGVTTSND